jgi:hypothetical protein
MRPHLIHCSYHKCLTVFFGRVMGAVFNRCQPWRAGYRHYNSDLDGFLGGYTRDRLSSINNRALDLEQLGQFRISRFIRDPRDLIVSGYFYHRRGAESWTTIKGPTEEDYYFANGVVPEAMRGRDLSFAEHLQSLSEEDGLLAEMEFRGRHLESMAQWPEEHPDILTIRYEEVLGNEVEVFRALTEFYGVSFLERRLAMVLADRHSLKRKKADPHVRNPASGQWRRHFTDRVRTEFDQRYAGLVDRLGYPPD